ncbi:hypothetical protein [Streptococcus infantarius]|uniref:Uncharacterized protein n=2 Tax=Streptococcus infantarius TaxID=102684 RepID=A0A380KPQ9_9STRE|nr:hypothetical protein [Streptococcus infantarius]EDT47826.1 hypothetical protein STRINF_00926 [Streptococcus infantarius subsp. infantarius ATCC BAA-102]MCO4477237.1 hypothetical protein [Streptococcus infantarius subsp. infantarius]QQB28709.1 hypothetical protein I6H76_06635 [Streptococcus infantarius]SUN69188.1 Uncharacterised protein [Streptococcus infantarius]
MITEEMMMTTETLLMSYYFDMSEWLKGIKRVNIDIIQKSKDELLDMLKSDFEELSTEDNNDYLDELSVSIATLEELSEDNYQKIKTEVFSWEPKK